jgi:hypothetical protein
VMVQSAIDHQKNLATRHLAVDDRVT